jgi:multiple antibiotic resistance protein
VLKQVLTASIVSLSAIFFVVDPFAVVPLFLAMTQGDSPAKRRAMARRASLVAFGLLAGFAVAGAFVFKALGITLPAFRIAGGILLLVMSVDMLRSRTTPVRATELEVEAGVHKEDVAIVPLAMPMLAGPGSIATVVVLMGRARLGPWWAPIPIFGAIAVTGVVTYFILGAASSVDRVLGRTGMNVLERVAGLLLAAIATQFILDGLAEVLPVLRMRH